MIWNKINGLNNNGIKVGIENSIIYKIIKLTKNGKFAISYVEKALGDDEILKTLYRLEKELNTKLMFKK